MRCAECGTENRDDAKFCRKCGASMNAGKRKSKKWLVCIAIIALMLITAAGTLLLRCTLPLPSGEESARSVIFAVANLDDYGFVVENEDSARQAIASLWQEIGIDDKSGQLGDCRIDEAYGWTYYRFCQEIDGREVQGCSITLGVNETGLAGSLSANAVGSVKAHQEPVIDRVSAENAILSIVGTDCEVDKAELVYYQADNGDVTLCYRSYIVSPNGAMYVFVSANDGGLLGQQALSYTEQVEGYGKTKARPDVDVSFMTERGKPSEYSLYDAGRAITVYNAKGKNVNAAPAYTDQSGKLYKYDTDNKQLVALEDNSTREYAKDCKYIGLYLSTPGVIGRLAVVTNDGTYWSDRTAVSAMHNVALAHDFYASVLKRIGFSNGTEHNLSVCMNTFSQTNSQWGATGADAIIRFSFDDAMEFDTAAHEFTHAVEQSISRLIYEGESGALMEAISDVFAELAEDYSDDGKMNNTCDWIQSGCRNLSNPEKSFIEERSSGKDRKSHPSRYQQDNGYWADVTPKYDDDHQTTNDYGHVHNNSTVISHAAYLMCNSDIEGKPLTTRELADVLYATLFSIPSNCDFAHYAGWVQYKARTMLTTQKARRVEAAFEAVNINPWVIVLLRGKSKLPSEITKEPNDYTSSKLITSFHITYDNKKSESQSYEEWVNASYDDQGRITHKEITRETSPMGWDGEPAYSLEYEYDLDGRLTRVSGSESYNEKDIGTVDWDIAYDGDGKSSRAVGTEYSDQRHIDDVYNDEDMLITRDYLIRTGQVLQNGNLTFSYDANGRITGQSAKTGYNGSQSSMEHYETNVSYDQSNRITSIEITDSSGQLFSRRTYDYDGAGRLAHRNHFYNGGTSSLTVSQSYTYDSSGHLVSIDQQGDSSYWDTAQATFETDEDGCITSARIESENLIKTYEVEYVSMSTPAGKEPFNAVDLVNPINPELYNELWVSHANLDPTPYDESEFLRENRRWLELHAAT